MLTYKRYIFRSIFIPLITIAFVLTSLVWITQILKLLYLIDKGVKLKDFFQLIILLIPFLLFTIFPLITVLAIVNVYKRLREERQLIVFRSIGLSDISIARPALLLAILITMLCYYISFSLLPFSYHKLKQELVNLKNNYISDIVDVRTFNQVSKHTTIYVDKKNPDGSLAGVVLFDNTQPESKAVLFASKGKIINNGKEQFFELQDGLRQAYDNSGNLTKIHFDRLQVEISNDNENELDKNKIQSTLELYIPQLLWPDKSLSEQKQHKLIVDGHQRIIWPLYNYVFAFLALSIFLKHPYNRKSNLKHIILTIIPLVLVTYIHFTMQKFAYQDKNFIFFCYLNVFFAIVFSTWYSRRKII